VERLRRQREEARASWADPAQRRLAGETMIPDKLILLKLIKIAPQLLPNRSHCIIQGLGLLL